MGEVHDPVSSLGKTLSMWDEAVSHKKFLGGTYLSGKNTIAGRLRWFVETQMRGPWISVLWSRSLSGSHQEDLFANFSANEISGVTHKAPRTDLTGEEYFLRPVAKVVWSWLSVKSIAKNRDVSWTFVLVLMITLQWNCKQFFFSSPYFH